MSFTLSLSERKTSNFLETVPEASTSGQQDLDLLENMTELNPSLLKPLVCDRSPLLTSDDLARSPSRTPTSPERPQNHDQLLQQMEAMRKEMQNGIEEMKLRIYQIQYCEKSLFNDMTVQSGPGNASSEVRKCPVQEPCDFEGGEDQHWGSIASAMLQNELIYESSPKSSAMDPSRPSSTSQDPHTPLIEDSNLQAYSPFPLNYTTAHVEISSINSLKSDVVLNLNTDRQGNQEAVRIRDEAPGTKKESLNGIDRLLGMFCPGLGPRKKLNSLTKRRHQKRWCSKQDKIFGKRLEMSTMFSRMGQTMTPFSSMQRNRSRGRLASGKGAQKFTDKYPIEETGPLFTPISGTFCPITKSQTVWLDPSLITARILEEEFGIGRVFSEDGIQDGIARFSVTSHSPVGECFVGIVSKEELATKEGNLQDWGSAIGWSHAGEILGARIHHEVMDLRQNRSPLLRSTFQVVLDLHAGTVHLRVQQKPMNCAVSSQICEFTEYELRFEPPSGSTWHLGIQWSGSERELRLDSVEKWQ